MDNIYEEYEPTDEEWKEIEEAILREEAQEIKEAQTEDRRELMILKAWLKEHGMLWDREDARSAEGRKK